MHEFHDPTNETHNALDLPETKKWVYARRSPLISGDLACTGFGLKRAAGKKRGAQTINLKTCSLIVPPNPDP